MDITELQREVNEFVREMGWYDEGSPHPQTPRNLAISLTLEAAEVLSTSSGATISTGTRWR